MLLIHINICLFWIIICCHLLFSWNNRWWHLLDMMCWKPLLWVLVPVQRYAGVFIWMISRQQVGMTILQRFQWFILNVVFCQFLRDFVFNSFFPYLNKLNGIVDKCFNEKSHFILEYFTILCWGALNGIKCLVERTLIEWIVLNHRLRCIIWRQTFLHM